MAKTADSSLSGAVSGKKHRIGTPGIVFWVSFAVLLDLLQFVLLLFIVGLFFNRVLAFLFSFAFFLYAWYAGIRLIRPGRLLALALIVADTLIPVAGGLFPLLSIGTALVIAESRAGEALGTMYRGRTEERAKSIGKNVRRRAGSIIRGKK